MRQAVTKYFHAFLQNRNSCHFLFQRQQGYGYTCNLSEIAPRVRHKISDINPDNGSSSLKCVTVEMYEDVLSQFKPFGERLPAMEKLVLIHYTWYHSQLEASQLWDLSRLHSLAVNWNVPMFLNNAPLSQFPQLEYLQLSRFRYLEASRSVKLEIRRLLRELLGELKSLKKFKLIAQNWQAYTDIEMITGIGNKLESLTVRAESLGPDASSIVSVSQLTKLQNACPNLAFLGLNLSILSPAASRPIISLEVVDCA
jgi:hypothetical protein